MVDQYKKTVYMIKGNLIIITIATKLNITEIL